VCGNLLRLNDVRLDGAERVILRRDARFGERIEHGGFTHVRKTDDTALETHDCFLG